MAAFTVPHLLVTRGLRARSSALRFPINSKVALLSAAAWLSFFSIGTDIQRVAVSDVDLLPGRLLRQHDVIKRDAYLLGGQIDDPELAEVLSPDAPLLVLHEGTTTPRDPRGRRLTAVSCSPKSQTAG